MSAESPDGGPWEALHDVAERSTRYLNAIGSRRVAPSANALAGLAAFDVPLQEPSIPAAQVVDELDRIGSPATMAIAGPRFFGFINSSALPAALAANWLSTAWEQHGGYAVSSPGSTTLERIALRWTIDLLGLPPTSTGAFVTGTTVAHVASLAAARGSLLARAGWNVEADGLFGAPTITVIAGAEAHPTLFKALGIVGLGRNRVVKVPVDSQGRMRAAALPTISGPTIVCVQAGKREYRRVRSVHGHHRARPTVRCSRVDSRRRRLRLVGARRTVASLSGGRHRARRFLGNRRA
jgi:glutamate/tyrosine decarboxylase-like PLP-dependent enzyme